jgi:signal transduction histidine kinase
VDTTLIQSYFAPPERAQAAKIAANKELPPPVLSGSRTIYSDRTLLSRVLGNLIKNALEASSSGQTVHVSFKNSGMAERNHGQSSPGANR